MCNGPLVYMIIKVSEVMSLEAMPDDIEFDKNNSVEVILKSFPCALLDERLSVMKDGDPKNKCALEVSTRV